MSPFRSTLVAAFAALAATTAGSHAAADSAQSTMIVRAVVVDACVVRISAIATVGATSAGPRAEADASGEAGAASLHATCTSGMRESAVLSMAGDVVGGPRVASAPLRREDPGGEWLVSNPGVRVVVMTMTF